MSSDLTCKKDHFEQGKYGDFGRRWGCDPQNNPAWVEIDSRSREPGFVVGYCETHSVAVLRLRYDEADPQSWTYGRMGRLAAVQGVINTHIDNLTAGLEIATENRVVNQIQLCQRRLLFLQLLRPIVDAMMKQAEMDYAKVQ